MGHLFQNISAPDTNAWTAWSPCQLLEKLKGVPANWYIVGGWALDLWLGQRFRAHDDLEFATTPEDAPVLARHLSELTFFEAKAGGLNQWDPHDKISETAWQFWGADLKEGRWRVDMMMERGTPEFWRYKRPPFFEMPRDEAVLMNSDGIKYLAPPNVLLFKAKHCREKDDLDFKAVFPKLSKEDRSLLYGWLCKAHAGHRWLQYFD